MSAPILHILSCHIFLLLRVMCINIISEPCPQLYAKGVTDILTT